MISTQDEVNRALQVSLGKLYPSSALGLGVLGPNSPSEPSSSGVDRVPHVFSLW